jgi:predicted transcriptional regulator
LASPDVIAAALDQVGSRLRRLRMQRGVSLAALSEVTGISKSTLSRLETGQRRASLELTRARPRSRGLSTDR